MFENDFKECDRWKRKKKNGKSLVKSERAREATYRRQTIREGTCLVSKILSIERKSTSSSRKNVPRSKTNKKQPSKNQIKTQNKRALMHFFIIFIFSF